MTRLATGTQVCSSSDATTRLAQARKFLEVAEIVASEREVEESTSVGASLAVLAGIAAADAACCSTLGRRSRSANHHDAEALLAQVHPGGRDAANALRRLLDLKDTAHYGLINVSHQRLTAARRQAGTLIEFAAEVARRR